MKCLSAKTTPFQTTSLKQCFGDVCDYSSLDALDAWQTIIPSIIIVLLCYSHKDHFVNSTFSKNNYLKVQSIKRRAPTLEETKQRTPKGNVVRTHLWRKKSTKEPKPTKAKSKEKPSPN